MIEIALTFLIGVIALTFLIGVIAGAFGVLWLQSRTT